MDEVLRMNPPMSSRSVSAISRNLSQFEGSTADQQRFMIWKEKIFWSLVLVVVVIALVSQGVYLTMDYYNEESGTRMIFLEPKDREEIIDLVQVVYCPQDWLNEPKVLKSGDDMPEMVAYAISLIPYVDFYALQSLENETNNRRRVPAKWSTRYDGAMDWWTNGEATFSHFETSEQAHQQFLETLLKLGFKTLLEFLSNFAIQMVKSSDLIGFVIRQGRVCTITKIKDKTFSNDGIDKASKIEMEFYHAPVTEKPAPEVFFSLYNYQAINSEKDRNLHGEVSSSAQSVVLSEGRNQSFHYTPPFKYNYSFYNQHFEVSNYRVRLRLDKIKRRCLQQKQSDVQRYAVDYLLWQCAYDCFDKAFIKVGRNCTEFSVLSSEGWMAGIRPCSSGTFGGVREVYGAGFYGDPFFLDNMEQLEKAKYNCTMNEQKCGELLECKEWRFELNNTFGFAMVIPNGTSKPYYHRITIYVIEGITLIEYPLLSMAEYLGSLGGLVGLFLGASIITFIDWGLRFALFIKILCFEKYEDEKKDVPPDTELMKY